MEIKKVTIQDGNYVCDIGVTVEEWKSILTDETLMFSTYKNALIKFYNEPEHKSTCKALGEKYNKNPQHFNRVITNFAKAVQKKLNRFEVIGTDNEPTYWIIPMTGKYLGKHFEWTLRPELVQAMEDLGMTEIENEYQQFKCLLAYFVVHLEYCVSKKEDTRGYQTYIAPIKDFKKSGQGYDGDKIQSQIQKWEKYQNGIVCINVNPTTFQGRGTYLNWKHTAINVNAIWEKNSVVKLKIVEDSYPLSNAKDVLENTLIELGIFDDNEPNDNLKAFFDKFNSLIIEWNKDKQNKEDMEQIKPYINLLKSNKNLILTGAPGTGKTYLTKQIAKQMIGVTTDEELEQSGQFAFVQFHPSYDHTDFVEGLRPTKPDENGNIGFELKDGIFKKFCNRALKNWIDSLKSIEELQKEQNIEDFVDEFLSDAIDNEIRFETTTHKIPYQIIEVNDDTVKIEHGNFNSRDYDPKNKYVIISKKDLIDILSISEKLKNKKNIRNVLSRNISSQNGNYLFSVYTEVHNRIDSSENQDSKEAKKIALQDFIFVIDEINRGEISKIFGELFFSIDPSYRGEKGAVKTQYSNMYEDENAVFYIPENVYIIGTMNDIDRSVESFDFAMRRRFTLKEITAKESQKMFDDEDWKDEAIKRMDNLNNAIWNEKEHIDGLNSSYHIGAAYFKNNLPKYDDSEKWDKLWEYHLQPLLSEYLRGTPNSTENLEKLANAYNAE